MGIKDFHCEMLELTLRLGPEQIDGSKLLEVLRGKEELDEEEAGDEDEDGDMTVVRTLGHREPSTDYHGHLTITLAKEGKSRIELRYHAETLEIEDEKPPFIEDVAAWLSEFIAREEISGRLNVAYTFDKSYAPTIALPFPLATSEKALAGASVRGISIQFPDKHPLDVAIVSSSPEATYISIFAVTNVRLKEFDVLTELRRLIPLMDSLIRRQEPDNAENEQTE
jgi:hypothetical protein